MPENKYHYEPLPEPIPITEHQWPEGTQPIVHTRTMTYNHENYIRDCIEGILMQKTSFPVKVLIHDDASTDETASIVEEYEKKYPKLIKAYYQKENSYSKGKEEKSKLRAPFSKWRTGKYEATCEGDDYWTDPLKLQKQVDFLESHPECVLAYHSWVELDDGEFKKPKVQFPATHTRLFRNLNLEYPPQIFEVLNVDTFLEYILKEHGTFGFVEGIEPAVKRRDSGGIWNSLDKIAQLNNRINTYEKLLEAYGKASFIEEVKRKLALSIINRREVIKKNEGQHSKNYIARDVRLVWENRLFRHYIMQYVKKKLNKCHWYPAIKKRILQL